ncbi:hypothetical protein FJQ98_02600 [Lysinibacillus agricola]|uniref:Transposase n=1 Tax=Lysinibacillus agricola TaxID=2590012 RepID=A0ABX7ASQ2_9BACI|nr:MULTISPECIES: hypothetical protein [Lysinibacillus]KOS59757.1 hypothetical protein AN161_27020 [Lysinibacillus sp. FJAT-14222]QQP12983.1 hypothetical protein FJQ98_02600 [Lysinibacillus agricola]
MMKQIYTREKEICISFPRGLILLISEIVLYFLSISVVMHKDDYVSFCKYYKFPNGIYIYFYEETTLNGGNLNKELRKIENKKHNKKKG